MHFLFDIQTEDSSSKDHPAKSKRISIDRISGPYSFHILKPLKQVQSNEHQYQLVQNMKSLPYIIMLGDYHGDARFLCDKCNECRADEDGGLNECCFEIFKDPIFELLDHVATQTKSNITIMLEHMDYQLNNDQLKQIFSNQTNYHKFMNDYLNDKQSSLNDVNHSTLNKFMYNFRNCFRNEIKKQVPSAYPHMCQAPNLNWVYADPRSVYIYNVNEPYKLEALMKHVWSIDMLGCIFVPRMLPDKYTLNRSFIDTYVINRLRQFFPNNVEQASFCTLMKLLYDLNGSKKFVQYMFDEEANAVNKYSMILSLLKFKSDEWFKFYDSVYCIKAVQEFLYNRINTHAQLQVENQVDKTDITKWKPFQDLINSKFKVFSSFFESLCTYISDQDASSYLQLEQTIGQLYPLFNTSACSRYYASILNSNFAGRRREDVDHFVEFYGGVSLNQVHTIHTSYLLDIYVLAQLFNHDENENDLVVLYAGSEHCDFLHQVLITYCGYSPSSRIPVQIDNDGNPIRCINLQLIDDPDLNINEWLASRKKK